MYGVQKAVLLDAMIRVKCRGSETAWDRPQMNQLASLRMQGNPQERKTLTLTEIQAIMCP